MSTDAIVELKGIGKTYETGVEALREVKLQLPRGQAQHTPGAERVRQDHPCSRSSAG